MLLPPGRSGIPPSATLLNPSGIVEKSIREFGHGLLPSPFFMVEGRDDEP